MGNKTYFIDRYEKKLNYSGYSLMPKFMNNYVEVKPISILNRLLKYFFYNSSGLPDMYLWTNSSKEFKALLFALFTRNPIHYLYADKDCFFIFYFKKLGFPIKLVGTFHWPRSALKNNNIKNVKYFDSIIVLGSSLFREYADLNKNINVIYHGIDKLFWSRIIPYSFNSNKNLLVVGESNRDHSKQIIFLNKFLEKYPNWQVNVLINDLKINEKYKKINQVKLLTYKSDFEFKQLYKISNFVILIQFDSVASNVVLESMSMGVPLLANNVGDISEYLGVDYPFLNSDLDVPEWINQEDYLLQLSNDLILKSRKLEWSLIAIKTQNVIANLVS